MFFKRLITTERFHIMVDIPEKMIDNSRHIIKYMVLQVSKNTQQIVRKAVEVNKHNSSAANKRITKKSVKWNLVNK
jgi:hypothetical protein